MPSANPAEAEAAALAIAGGKVVGAALKIDGEVQLAVASNWRGRGIEEALTQALKD